MADLTTHITDSGHNWIIPTCDTGSTDLADFYTGSGILNWPTGYTGSNFIQANWSPLTDSWYIEIAFEDIPYSTVEQNRFIKFSMKENSDITFYGPEVKVYADSSNDIYANFNTYDGSGINYVGNGDNNINGTDIGIRLEVINGGESIRGYTYQYASSGFSIATAVAFNSKQQENVLFYPSSLNRAIVGFNTGTNNQDIKITRFKASDFIPDLYTCYDIGPDYGYAHYVEIQDEFIGDGYVSSHLPDLDFGGYGFYYVSSASATISNSYVTPAIFQLIAPASLPYIHCGFFKLDLKEFEKVTFRMYDSSNDMYFNIELRWAVETSCKIEFIATNPPYDPEEIISQSFSIGEYQTSDELIVFFEMDGNAFSVYVAPDLTTPIATIYPDANSWPSRIRLRSMNVMSDFGTSSAIDYIRLCQYNPG